MDQVASEAAAVGAARPSADQMDDNRSQQEVYQYLCRLQEVKLWLEKILNISLPEVEELEESLRNGVILAHLGNYMAPEVVPLSSIYDADQKRFEAHGLQFRHTENINLWLSAVRKSEFPRIFIPEVPDIYEKKNMPKLVYCLHALSAHLFRKGLAPPVQDLCGQITFSDAIMESVCKELKEAGVAMPTFQKINGAIPDTQALVPKPSVNPIIASVHEALCQENAFKLGKALNDPNLKLEAVNPQNLDEYLRNLKTALNEKLSNSKNIHGKATLDRCDSFQTLSEIQGHIHSINLSCLLKQLKESFKIGIPNVIEDVLTTNKEVFGAGYEDENKTYYIELLESINVNDITMDNVKDVLQQIIKTGNNRAEADKQVAASLQRTCFVLKRGTCMDLMDELKLPYLQVQKLVREFAAPLYFFELQDHVNMTGKLTADDVKSSIHTLNLVADVTCAVDCKDSDALWHALTKLNNHMHGVLELPEHADRRLRTSYLDSLEYVREDKLDLENNLLSLDEIEDVISKQNQETEKLGFIQSLNEAVIMCDHVLLQDILKFISPEITSSEAKLWMHLLKAKMEEKQAEEQELWISDITEIGQRVITIQLAINQRIQFLNDIKKAISANDSNKLKELISTEGINTDIDFDKLLVLLKEAIKVNNSNWTEEKILGIKLYLNTCLDDEKNFEFKLPELSGLGFGSQCIKMAIEELEVFDGPRDEINSAITIIQAHIRGYLVRKQLCAKKAAALKLQRWWRKKRQLIRNADGERFMDYYLDNMKEIKKIQDCYENRMKRKAERDLSPAPQCKNATYDVNAKAAEDLIQKLRFEVMESIKKNQDLSKKVDDMDTKIGLLVRNRISISALMAEKKNQKQTSQVRPCGLKSLSKETKTILDSYQKLFYLLQTRPEYLSRLITQSPSSLTIQSCIMNLFNIGSCSRDSYLLLRLFDTALNEEVKEKFKKPTDAVTGNPLVLKLAVAFARQTGGQHPLQVILAPLIYRVLEEKATLETNPVDIYRRWVNEMEVSSGAPSQLPRLVSQEVALKHPEVVQRLQTNIDLLKKWVTEFLNSLTENVNIFPYPLKFIAKSLSEALKVKFPEITEKEILKIIGHMIYYQYVNSAIVAPDAFQIINLPPQQPLRAEQRKNLASIAKILQFSASKNGFGEESAHLMQLNPFIIECHEVMKQLSRSCCQVVSLEKKFHVSQYSEAMLLQRPRIYMTIAELCECHHLVAKNKNIVAPDSKDPIHAVLEEFKEVPTPASLLGCSNELAANMQMEKTLICLELDNEFWAESSDENSRKSDRDAKERSLRREAQNQEIRDLEVTLSRLNIKTAYFEEQLRFYEKYLETCLKNLTLRKKNKTSRSVKYTGTQLLEKGVLVSIDGVPSNQMKNVQFELSSTEQNGRFLVRCSFMGVQVDTTHIDIQHLLSLQFEGCGVMNIFGKAEVNVNLLLHLLNKKFIQRCGTLVK